MHPELKQTPLRQAHLDCGARLVGFAGWEMPVQYRGINEEHHAVRTGVGLFDVSHMGQIHLEGPGVMAFLQYLLPPDLAGLAVGRICYAVMCNQDGGALDDLLVYRLDEQAFLLVVNASRLDTDLAWIRERAGDFPGVHLADRSAESGMVAVQGPLAAALIEGLGGGTALDLGYLECTQVRLAGHPLLISRSGYTGEDGFELICPVQDLGEVWAALLDKGGQPCGLGARDVLRTEMGYCLYGHELTPEHTPLEAGLSWSVSLTKESGFVGREALRRQQEQGLQRRLVGLRLVEQGIPRAGYPILDPPGKGVGVVSSGTYSPGLQCGIALAYVDALYCRPGTPLLVDLRGKSRRAEVVKTPFVPAHTKRKRGRR